MRLRTALTLGALTVGILATSAGSALSQTSSQTYIVQMLEAPAVAYDGGVSGLPATKPGKGNKINPAADNVENYRAYLKGTHDKALQNVGGGTTVYDYGVSFNGFAAKLSEAQAASMRLQKGVVAVTPDELQSVDTFSTPAFLGLTANGGLWDQLGGVSKGGLNKGAGEDIIIGVIDSGIWPESQVVLGPQARRLEREPVPAQGPGFHGTCQAGEQFTASNCNKKLIGARHFNAAWGGDAALEALRPWEFMSPRDYNSHGTHTASTRAATTASSRPVRPFPSRDQRHRAARTHLRVQGLWSTQDGSTASGFTTDLVPRSTLPLRTASTSSTTRSAGRTRTSSTRSRSRSCSQRMPVSSCPRRLATPGLARDCQPPEPLDDDSRSRACTTVRVRAPSRSATAPSTTVRRTRSRRRVS